MPCQPPRSYQGETTFTAYGSNNILIHCMLMTYFTALVMFGEVCGVGEGGEGGGGDEPGRQILGSQGEIRKEVLTAGKTRKAIF